MNSPMSRRGMVGLTAAGALASFAAPTFASENAFTAKTFDVVAAGAGRGEDDTAVIDGCVRRLVDAGGGILRFPAGVYRIGRRITVPLPGNVSFAVRGDGAGLSRIVWTGDDGGFDIRFPPEGGFDGLKSTVEVSGVGLLTNAVDRGSALRLVSDGGSSPAPRKIVRDVVIAGTGPNAGWEFGIDAVDCTFLSIDGLDFQGTSQKTGTAIRFAGTKDPVDNYVSRLRVFGAKTGIKVTGNSEGVYVTQSTLLFVERGVHWHTDAGEPLLVITGCHVNAYRDCVLGHNLMQPIIADNLLYQSGDDEWAGVRLTGDAATPHDLVQITGNTIHGFSTSGLPRHGVVIENRSGGLVRGNLLHRVDLGVWLKGGSSEIRMLDNVASECPSPWFLDEGRKNVVREV